MNKHSSSSGRRHIMYAGIYRRSGGQAEAERGGPAEIATEGASMRPKTCCQGSPAGIWEWEVCNVISIKHNWLFIHISRTGGIQFKAFLPGTVKINSHAAISKTESTDLGSRVPTRAINISVYKIMPTWFHQKFFLGCLNSRW